jgi:DNA-directed RNA polymerase subunit RPC12/RpoP
MSDLDDQNQLGKRYRCETCGTEVLCMKRGEGRFQCHGVPMAVIVIEDLPASD